MRKAKRNIFLVLCVLLISLLLVISGSALQTDGAGNATGASKDELDIEGDYYYFLDSTEADEKIKGKIGGDILGLASNLEIEAEVGGSIRLASVLSLSIRNSSARNITVAAADLTIGENTTSKAVYAGAQIFRFDGTCDYLEVWAEEVYIYGTIKDSAKIHADNVYFADTCDVSNVKVEGMNTPKFFEKGNERILKDYTENQTLKDRISYTQTYNQFQQYMANLLYTLPAAIVLTLLLCLMLGKQLDEAGDMFKHSTGRHIGYGVIGAFLIPIAIFFLIVIPYTSTAGIVLGVGYLLLAIVANCFTAASLSRIIMPSLNRYLSSIIGVTIVTLLTLLTTLDALFTLFSLIYIFGYAIIRLFFKKPELPPLNNTIQM